jgi:hypothetical protein
MCRVEGITCKVPEEVRRVVIAHLETVKRWGASSEEASKSATNLGNVIRGLNKKPREQQVQE